ncbi:hypothetical protein [Candidatus Palauibacter sp.]|uniref:hypothetical protein n=1 Tax=Candidatus Palauibacter sp. TaxID=3101350 RepID=UPI003AF1F24F
MGGRLTRTGWAGAVSAFVVAGCLATGSVLQARGTGLTRCYRLQYETLWERVVEAVRYAGLVIERENVENGFVLAHSYQPDVERPEDMALDADQGEVVGVFVEPEGRNVWAVEVVSQRRFALDPSPRDWTAPVFLALENRLPAEASAPNDDLAACARARSLMRREPRPTPGRG